MIILDEQLVIDNFKEYANKPFSLNLFLRLMKRFGDKIEDCDKCSNMSYAELNKICIDCRDRKLTETYFDPIKNELKSLFSGAPVMARNPLCKTSEWEMFTYKDSLNFYTFSEIHRLPTVEEAPRNVWLAPWIKMPKELSKFRVLLWAKNGMIKIYAKGRCEPNNINWDNVIKVQILGE